MSVADRSMGLGLKALRGIAAWEAIDRAGLRKPVKLCGSLGLAESELLEKWARDVKILDLFEGTQQIQQLIIARQLLGTSSGELK